MPISTDSMQREVLSTVIVVKPRVTLPNVGLARPVVRVEPALMRELSILVWPKHLLIGRLLTHVFKVGICLDCVRRGFVVINGLKKHRHTPEILDHAAILRTMAHPQLVEVFHDGAMDGLGWEAEDNELWCIDIGHPNGVAEAWGILRPHHMLNVQPMAGYVVCNRGSDSPGDLAVTGSHRRLMMSKEHELRVATNHQVRKQHDSPGWLEQGWGQSPQ